MEKLELKAPSASKTLDEKIKMAGVEFTAYYSVTTIDPPELVRFIIEEHGIERGAMDCGALSPIQTKYLKISNIHDNKDLMQEYNKQIS